MSIMDRGNYVLAVKQLQTSAEVTRLEAEELHRHGYESVQVVGLRSVLWVKNERLHATEAALAKVWAIPE